MNSSQKDKAQQLHKLHQSGKMLILPNVWDSLGAALLEKTNNKVVATASAAIAFTNGYYDGENISLDEVLIILKKIVDSVSIPVTADIESGYAKNDTQLKENIILFLRTGIAGINIEDTNTQTNSLYSIEEQSNRIRIVKDVAAKNDIPLFINAKTDVLVRGIKFASAEARFDEMLMRGAAYKQAGADCFFPITLKEKDDIEKLVAQLKMPVNILAFPGIPDLKTLSDIGVTRVSLGPGLLKIAIKAMRDLALQLQSLNGLSDITNNDITSDYLKSLVGKMQETKS